MEEGLGDRIREALSRAGLNQAALARYLGVEQGTVSGWVTGRREPDAATITRIAELCWVTTDELLGRVPFPPAMEGAAPSIRAALRESDLSPEEVSGFTGIPAELIENWANDEGRPRQDAVDRILALCRGGFDVGKSPPYSPPSARPASDHAHAPADALLAVRQGDWEALARTIAEALLKREDTEQLRARADLVAREAELIAQQNVQAAIAEAIAVRSAASANYVTDPAERSRLLQQSREFAKRAGEKIRAEAEAAEPVPQE